MIELIEKVPALMYALQLFWAECLMMFLLPKKKYWWAYFIGFSLLLFGVSLVIPDLIFGGLFYLPLIVCFGIIGISFYFMLDFKLNGLLFGLICVGLMQHTAECFTMSVRHLFDVQPSTWAWMWTSLLCYVVVYGLYFLYFRKRAGGISLKTLKVTLIAFIVFMVVFNLRNLAAIVCEKYSVNRYITAIYNGYATICCVLCCSYMFSSGREETLNKEKEQLLNLLQKEQAQYHRLVSSQDTINRKCHDLKYQIVELQRSTTTEAREEKLLQLEKDVLIYENLPKTGNVALDYTISDKYLLCQQQNVKFTYIVDGSSLEFMEPTDIYSLFGNALDNAIECVLRCDDVEKRIISLNVNKHGDMLHVHLENYCADEVVVTDNEVKTSKNDKENHGFGIKSMKYIVEKYGGIINLSFDRNIFSLDIVFAL